jgi:hypothetical protein
VGLIEFAVLAEEFNFADKRVGLQAENEALTREVGF